jgi:hypothetical protein
MQTQGPIDIPGAPWARWQLTTAHYDYAQSPTICPICGSVGWVWKGWFSCDGRCQAIAVIADGRTFLPVPKPRDREETPPERHQR